MLLLAPFLCGPPSPMHIAYRLLWSRFCSPGPGSALTIFADDPAARRAGLFVSPAFRHPQAALLRRYLADTNEAEVPQNVLNFVVNQDPSDPAYFQVIQRFPGPTGMVAHQSGASYSAFVRSAQPLLAESLGVYLCKESGGKIGQALYPWGPKGEGGRDDMVVRFARRRLVGFAETSRVRIGQAYAPRLPRTLLRYALLSVHWGLVLTIALLCLVLSGCGGVSLLHICASSPASPHSTVKLSWACIASIRTCLPLVFLDVR